MMLFFQQDLLRRPAYRIARGWELSSDEETALHLFCE
jgi:hypothetical protein